MVLTSQLVCRESSRLKGTVGGSRMGLHRITLSVKEEGVNFHPLSETKVNIDLYES